MQLANRLRGPDLYLYYNGHGDLAAEANSSGTRTALHTYDPFGAPLDTQPADQTVHRYTGAWAKQYDTASDLILMGARPYDPSLGRFLAVDPFDGGSLNNYDYAGQDPINKFDLDGLMMQDVADGGCADGCTASRDITAASPGTIADRVVGKTVVNVVKASVKTVAKYTPSNGKQLVQVYSITETVLITGALGALTAATVVVVCPAAVAAGGPVGAAACGVDVAGTATLTAAAALAAKKEAEAYIAEKKRGR